MTFHLSLPLSYLSAAIYPYSFCHIPLILSYTSHLSFYHKFFSNESNVIFTSSCWYSLLIFLILSSPPPPFTIIAASWEVERWGERRLLILLYHLPTLSEVEGRRREDEENEERVSAWRSKNDIWIFILIALLSSWSFRYWSFLHVVGFLSFLKK